MEETNLSLQKPEFNGEIQARVKSLGEIESNIKEVQNYVKSLNEYYKKVIFTDDTMKTAKEEKAKVNKFKTQISDYRKNILAEYNKPIKIFEDTAKETEKLLTDTYNTINQQVATYEDKVKKEKEQEIKDYFEEYKQSLNIDFITFGDTKIKVGISDSKASLKKQAKDFVDKVNTDLATIMLQENKEEILVEYKQSLNLNMAIQTVINRHKLLDEEKKKQEELKNKQLEEVQKQVDMSIKEQELATQKALNNFVIEAPKVEEEREEILTLRFTVKATSTKLKKLKDFLIQGGYDYE